MTQTLDRPAVSTETGSPTIVRRRQEHHVANVAEPGSTGIPLGLIVALLVLVAVGIGFSLGAPQGGLWTGVSW